MAQLFIPGPTDVDPSVSMAQTQQMIGHRSQDCVDLIHEIQPKLQQVFLTDQRVYLFPSSGSGIQEAALRNCTLRKALICTSGAFGERWVEVAQQNGIPADALSEKWGQVITPDRVMDALKKDEYDVMAIVHNETSTGVENPIREIAAQVKDHNNEILILVDAVSSAGGVEIRTQEWGLDVVLTASQKCFALPPGLAFAAVSDAALERAALVPNRGWYFDFLKYENALQRYLTPTTPPISLLFALDLQLDRMLAEGLVARFNRHGRLARRAQDWAETQFSLFAPERYRSKTVTTVQTPDGFPFEELAAQLGQDGISLANGYGKLRETTFRIGHMGEIKLADLDALLERMDQIIERLR
jgi:predicted phosphoserine aminotransferase